MTPAATIVFGILNIVRSRVSILVTRDVMSMTFPSSKSLIFTQSPIRKGFDKLMPAELSGGMLKRAGLARALVMDPRVLFFDEPSAGLDPVVAVELDELILKLRDAMGMTIVVVTHELESAFKIADRITVLDKGRLVITGTVDEVRATDNERVQDLFNRRPRNEAVDRDDYLHRLTGYRHDA